jgi:hypothetical protein
MIPDGKSAAAMANHLKPQVDDLWSKALKAMREQ